jgi:hypothetical protein
MTFADQLREFMRRILQAQRDAATLDAHLLSRRSPHYSDAQIDSMVQAARELGTGQRDWLEDWS